MCQMKYHVQVHVMALVKVMCYFHVLLPVIESGEEMEYVFSIEAMVHGYHENKDIWDAPVREILPYQRDIGNNFDTFAVAVVKEGTIVGYCPRKFSVPCFIFIRRGGSITCQVTGGRRYSSGGSLCIEISIKEQARYRKGREVDKELFEKEHQCYSVSYLFLP